MIAPQAATCCRQWVILPEKCSGADAIMQAEMNRDIISAPCLNDHSEVSQDFLSVLKPKEVKFLSGPQLLGEMTTQPALIYFRHFPTQDDSRRNDTKQWLHGRLTL